MRQIAAKVVSSISDITVTYIYRLSFAVFYQSFNTLFLSRYKVTYLRLNLANNSAIKRAANIGQVRVLKTAQKINKNYSLKRIQK